MHHDTYRQVALFIGLLKSFKHGIFGLKIVFLSNHLTFRVFALINQSVNELAHCILFIETYKYFLNNFFFCFQRKDHSSLLIYN